MTTWEAGARLGHYELLSKVGAGGMGKWKGRDTRLERFVAIKRLTVADSRRQPSGHDGAMGKRY